MKEKSALAVAIGIEIRRIRTEQQRSQEGLADDCGINRNYMGNIERGEQDISVVMTKRNEAFCGGLEARWYGSQTTALLPIIVLVLGSRACGCVIRAKTRQALRL
jgi:transcriptional regulator with XRE-family HTH domain